MQHLEAEYNLTEVHIPDFPVKTATISIQIREKSNGEYDTLLRVNMGSGIHLVFGAKITEEKALEMFEKSMDKEFPLALLEWAIERLKQEPEVYESAKRVLEKQANRVAFN